MFTNPYISTLRNVHTMAVYPHHKELTWDIASFNVFLHTPGVYEEIFYQI